MYRPNELYYGKPCRQRKTNQSLGKSDSQCPYCTFTAQGRKFPFKANNFIFLEVWPKVFCLFENIQITIQEILRDVCCPGRFCSRQKCVYVHTWKENDELWYECLKCKTWCYVLNIPFQEQNPMLIFWRWWYILFCQKDEFWLQKQKSVSFLKEFLRQSQSSTLEPEPKKLKKYSIFGIIVSTPHWLIQLTKNFHFIHLQSTLKQHDFLSLRRRYWVVSRLWTRFSYSDCSKKRQ